MCVAYGSVAVLVEHTPLYLPDEVCGSAVHYLHKQPTLKHNILKFFGMALMRLFFTQIAVRPLILASCLLAGCAGSGPSVEDLTRTAEAVLGGGNAAGLSNADITAGLKEALAKGSSQVVGQLGQQNGFSNDPVVRIPLPATLRKARDFASKVGMEKSFDDLELKLNRAAERATPKAKKLFIGAIKDMSVQDARGILQGPDNAATQYFEQKTGAGIKGAMRPLVNDALGEVGAVQSFNRLLAQYRTIPLAPKVDADLTGHVVDKGSDGIFHYLAEEEKAIRTNPLKRTSELLQRVFGAQ